MKTTAQKLIDAAAALLDNGGEDAVTLRAVGHAAGVSHNTPYRHFSDRADLLAAVAEQDFNCLLSALQTIERSDKAAMSKVTTALETFIAYGEAHPTRYRMLFTHHTDATPHGERVKAVATATFTTHARLIKLAQDAGQLPDLPTPTLTSLIYATVHGLLDFKACGRMSAEKGLSSVSDGTKLLLDIIRPAR